MLFLLPQNIPLKMLNGLTSLEKLKKFVFDVLTLSYPKKRLFTLLLILFLLFLIPVELLESLPDFSLCHQILGEYCYSSGITRGTSSLLKGGVSQALQYNPLSIPVLIILFLFIIFDSVKFISMKK